MNRRSYVLTLLASFMIFLGVSLKLDFSVKEDQQLKKIELKKYPSYFDINSIAKLYAENEDQWDGVRNVVTFVKTITSGINALLKRLEAIGILNKTGTFTTTEGGYKIKLVTNDPNNASIAGIGTTKEFSHRIIFWNENTNMKYLEVFFDNPTKKTEEDGVLVTFEPYQSIGGNLNYNNGEKMECYTKNTTMICSWDGALLINGPTEKAQLIATITDGVLSINLLVKLNLATTTSINNNLPSICKENPIGSERYYYTVIALIKSNPPYYTTSAFGVKKDAKGLNLGNCSNSYNYGYFNTSVNPNVSGSKKYFAGIGNIPPSSDYPSTSNVNSLLNQDPTKTQVDNLSIDFDSQDQAP